MHDLSVSPADVLVGTPSPLFDKTAFNAPAGTTIIPGGFLDRMRDIAMRADLSALRAQTVAMRPMILQLRAASDDTDVEGIIQALEQLGVGVGRLTGDIFAYVRVAQAGIDLINALFGLSNAFTASDTALSTFVTRLGAGEFQVISTRLTAKVMKEHKGFVIGDNNERIDRARIEFEVTEGPPPSRLILFATLRAFGIGQDAMQAPMQVQVQGSDGTGDPSPAPRETIDRLGTEINQVRVFERNNVSKLAIDLNGGMGQIDYGLNGANVALVLQVSGLAAYSFGVRPLREVTAFDIGLST